MVDSPFLITLSKPSFRHSSEMDRLPLPNQLQQSHKNKKKQSNSPNPIKTPSCDRSRMAAVDMAILIAVLFSFGFLIFPYLKLFYHGIAGICNTPLPAIRSELGRAQSAYLVLGLAFLVLAIAIIGIFRYVSGRKCENPNCRGLRKAADFDIQIETEENLKNSNTSIGRDGVGKGWIELGEGHNRELEAELKKIAPMNGRAVLVFRARCGCSVGRLVVWGPKKLRKVKK